MVKIKTYKIGQKGLRGRVIGLPKVWLDDLALDTGDVLNFYRTENDLLVITNQDLASIKLKEVKE